MSTLIVYDRFGRMKYNPEIHPNQGKPWTTTEQKYLIDNYEKLGPEQLSFDLGRTIHTVMQKACSLRKQGAMKKPSGKMKRHRRMSPAGLGAMAEGGAA